MALLKDAKIKVINTDRYGRKVAKVYVGRYVEQYYSKQNFINKEKLEN